MSFFGQRHGGNNIQLSLSKDTIWALVWQKKFGDHNELAQTWRKSHLSNFILGMYACSGNFSEYKIVGRNVWVCCRLMQYRLNSEP